jgi:hypothetical protein
MQICRTQNIFFLFTQMIKLQKVLFWKIIYVWFLFLCFSLKCCQTHLLRVNRLQHPQFDLFVSSNPIFYVFYFSIFFVLPQDVFWNNAQKSCSSLGEKVFTWKFSQELTYVCQIYVESSLMTIHVEVMMVHDQRRLNQSTAMVVQWKLVCHRTVATLYLRHYHGWILILVSFLFLFCHRKNLFEVFCIKFSFLLQNLILMGWRHFYLLITEFL